MYTRVSSSDRVSLHSVLCMYCHHRHRRRHHRRRRRRSIRRHQTRQHKPLKSLLILHNIICACYVFFSSSLHFFIILTEPTIFPCLRLSLCLTSVSAGLYSSVGVIHVQQTTFLFYDNYFSCAQSSESYHIKIQFEDESVWSTVDVYLVYMCACVCVCECLCYA